MYHIVPEKPLWGRNNNVCMYVCIIHHMQGHLDFSRSVIALKCTGADTFVSFLFRQLPEFLLNVDFFKILKRGQHLEV